MDLFTFLLCKKKGGGGLTYTLSADTINKQIVLTPSEGDAQAITVPYATDASTVNGKDVPELENGKIPATYLPSYVDDVLEYEDLAHFPAEGEVGKIYVARDTGLIYRWGGSIYAEINQSLALGETEATAYRGDRGKIAYDHSQSAHAPSNAEANQNAFSNITVGDTTIEADSKTDTLTLEAGNNITLTPDASTDKVTITATDTTYSDATTSVSGLMSGSDKTKLNGIATGAEVNQNTFSNVKIGSTTIAADSKTDTLELEAGDNIELTPDSTNDKITISGIPVTRTIRDASIASFSDGGNAPIPSLTASIVPMQDLHGYDSPWAGGAGKNLFNKPNLVMNKAIPQGTVIYGQIFGVTASFKLYGYDENDNEYEVMQLSVNKNSTTTTRAYTRLEISQSALNALGNNGELMVSLSDFTRFEPFSNICPISGWTEEVITVSPNKLIGAEWKDGYYINASGQEQSSNWYKYTTTIINVKPSTTYYVQMDYQSTDELVISVPYYDNNGDFISRDIVVSFNTRGIHGGQFTTPSNCYGIRVSLPRYSTAWNLQEGESIVADNTTTIPFLDSQGQSVEVFGGSVDVINGGEQPNKYVKKTLYDAWSVASNGVFYLDGKATDGKVGTLNTEADVLCSIYPKGICVGATSGAIQNPKTLCIQDLNGIRFMVYDTSFESLADFNAYVAQNGIEIRYTLATPTTFYTQPTSIKSLDGENNVGASTGDVCVTYVTQGYQDLTVNLADTAYTAESVDWDNIENKPTITDEKVTQTPISTDASYEILFSGTADNTTRTEGVGKNARFTYNPSTRQIRLNGPTTSSKSAINTYIEPSYVKATYQQGFGSLGYSDYQSILDGRYLRLKGSDYRSEHGTAEAEIKINSEAIVHIDQDEEKFRLSTLYGAGRLALTDGESTPTSLIANNTDIVLSGTNNTWDGVNTSLKSALAAIQNNLYIANYNKTASLSSGSNMIALDMTGYTYNGSDIINVYVDGLYKINNTDYTITVNDSTGVASINYTAAAAATMAIQVIKPKIGFTALTDNNGDNVTDSNGNSIDI